MPPRSPGPAASSASPESSSGSSPETAGERVAGETPGGDSPDGQFDPQDWVLFLSVSLIWGSSFLLIAEALESMEPGLITLGRTGLGAITLGLLRLGRRLRPTPTPTPTSASPSASPGDAAAPLTRLLPEDRSRVLVLSVVWVALPFTLFPLAEQHINSALTGLLNGAVPIFAAIIGAAFLAQRPRGAQLAGLIIGFLGVVLISLPSIGEGGSQATGVAMVLGATVCYGIAVHIARPLQQRYGALTLMSSVLGLAALWNIPFALYRFGENEFDLGPVLAVIFLGAVGTGLAYWIMATLVGTVGAVRASFITYVIPVVSLVLGVVFRDDSVAVLAIVGAALTIGGAYAASRAA